MAGEYHEAYNKRHLDPVPPPKPKGDKNRITIEMLPKPEPRYELPIDRPKARKDPVEQT